MRDSPLYYGGVTFQGGDTCDITSTCLYYVYQKTVYVLPCTAPTPEALRIGTYLNLAVAAVGITALALVFRKADRQTKSSEKKEAEHE